MSGKMYSNGRAILRAPMDERRSSFLDADRMQTSTPSPAFLVYLCTPLCKHEQVNSYINRQRNKTNG